GLWLRHWYCERRFNEAVDLVNRLGGVAHADRGYADWEHQLANALGLSVDRMLGHRTVRVHLFGARRFTADELRTIAAMPGLTTLDLSYANPVDDATLAEVGRAASLQVLQLTGTRPTSASVASSTGLA